MFFTNLRNLLYYRMGIVKEGTTYWSIQITRVCSFGLYRHAMSCNNYAMGKEEIFEVVLG